MSKPYIVIREQPKGSNNYYKYLYANVRENNKHTTECIQYLGKAEGSEDKSVSRADLDDDIIQEYDVDVQNIVDEEETEEDVTKDDIGKNVKGNKKPTTKDFIGKEFEIEYGYPNTYLRYNPPLIRVSKGSISPKKNYAHEVGHGVHLDRMNNSERKEIDELHQEIVDWYKDLDHWEKKKYYSPEYRGEWSGGKVESEHFAECFAAYFSPEKEGYKGIDAIPPQYKEYFNKKYGEPRDMKFPKEIEQLKE